MRTGCYVSNGPAWSHCWLLPSMQRLSFISLYSAHRLQITAVHTDRTLARPEWVIIARRPTAVPACSRQHSVRQPCFQLNRFSHLEQFTNHHLNSTVFQHLPTTPEDSSVLQQHHRHRLIATIRDDDSSLLWHMARYKCWLLTYFNSGLLFVECVLWYLWKKKCQLKVILSDMTRCLFQVIWSVINGTFCSHKVQWVSSCLSELMDTATRLSICD